MKQEKHIAQLLYIVQRYVTFFLLVGFVVTCCMMLFISSMQRAMDLTFTSEDLQLAAKLTFGNVVLLTALFGLFDSIRRRIMVERPVRQIVQAAEKLMQGDFTARVPVRHSIDRKDGLVAVAECFNQLAEELSGTETLRTDFIANVSHELKTPLAVIQNTGVLLTQPNLSEAERQEYARTITDTSRRLASLMTNILKLNKLENQQIFPKKQVFDLGEQLCECLLGFEDAWERKELDIETDLAENVLAEGDPELLTLVWNNLFSNAIKFTPKGGRVSLRLYTEGSSAVVSVSDTGCGFGRDVGRHIFEKFYQGDASRAVQGNGLGLALVKRVVDIVRGDISVESTPGMGSTFTVRIGRKMNV